MTGRIHIIGASGRSGAALCQALATERLPFVPVIRNPAKWTEGGLSGSGEPRRADLTEPAGLRDALRDATCIVSCAHARHAPAILKAAPPDARFVFLGSTRKFTRWPDEHARGVLAGQAAFLGSGRSGVMLHPTMIYGAAGEDNVQRLAALLRRLPVLPLPAGGKALVQPIYQDDVTRCLRAALDIAWRGPHTIMIAGPAPLPYADFVREVAHAAGLPASRILPIPAPPLMAAAALTRFLPLIPAISPAEIRRLLEDKAFDIGAMTETLGVHPIPLREGLARTFPMPRTR